MTDDEMNLKLQINEVVIKHLKDEVIEMTRNNRALQEDLGRQFAIINHLRDEINDMTKHGVVVQKGYEKTTSHIIGEILQRLLESEPFPEPAWATETQQELNAYYNGCTAYRGALREAFHREFRKEFLDLS